MKSFIVLALALLVSVNCLGQSKVLQSLSMKSALLNTSIKYSVYLPDNYDNSKTNYPVIYLLNGFTGNETDWIMSGDMKAITDQLIASKTINPMIIIMPDGDDRLYMNKNDGSYPYEDMFITELIPFVEKNYRIKSQKTSRAISGLSMGGSGSLRLALKYHTMFSACAAFSAGISTDDEIIAEDQQSFDSYFGRIAPASKGKTGADRLTEPVKDYDVLRLVNSKDAELLKTVGIYFDCGDDDFLTIGNSQLHIELIKHKIPHEFRMRDGGHTWEFWRESLPIGLEFINSIFQQKRIN
ncbi:MAG: alpha/beta hydrolase-fold protein [Psychroserpens sp.]|uniref:alpha/beta hydrolase n=1 Tax=Psychroserpens sp. TaxID=2020870 RepID=UPI003C822E42